MKNLVIGISLATATFNTNAADERQVSNIVKKYSEAIACQITETQYQKNQYKAVNVKPGFADLGGVGAVFVVYWQGDVGCAGGNSTVVPNFTVVEQRGFSSVLPVVVTDYKFPELDLVRLTSLSGKNEQLVIKGVTYGANDQQHSPTKVVTYKLKLIENEFVKQ